MDVHVILKNGDLKNIGFLGKDLGVRDEPNFENLVSEYSWGAIQSVDVSNVDWQSVDFQGDNYNLVLNNCQTYCTFIRKQL